jgi:hypothetical protein
MRLLLFPVNAVRVRRNEMRNLGHPVDLKVMNFFLDTTIGGAIVCFALRLMAIRYGWNLPVARPVETGEADGKSD